MNRKLTITALCVATVATSTLAVGLRPAAKPTAAPVDSRPAADTVNVSTAPIRQASASPAQAQAQTADADAKGQPQGGQVPQYIVYRHLFRHVVTLKNKADEEERHGRDGAALRTLYKRNAELNDAEAAALAQIAEDADRQVAELDARAKQIIAEARAQHPGGELRPGETLPPPPAELAALQEERNAAVLQWRDRLRAVFGEDGFRRFDAFVQRDVAPRIKPVQLGIPRPVTPGNPRQQQQQRGR